MSAPGFLPVKKATTLSFGNISGRTMYSISGEGFSKCRGQGFDKVRGKDGVETPLRGRDVSAKPVQICSGNAGGKRRKFLGEEGGYYPRKHISSPCLGHAWIS